ncbi:MAG: hypothetical protein RIQ93_3152 [Verrucomicrobiota bacterium]|jgi:hypothetical protein
MNSVHRRFPPAIIFLAAILAVPRLLAWDHGGHTLVNLVALASLPVDFPEFVRTPANAERIGFLSGEPDRWSHALDLPLRHKDWLDHFCDLEQIPAAGLDFSTLPSFRYDFVVAFAAARVARPGNFPLIDAKRNSDHTQQWPGFLPWAVAENYGRLKAAFSSLKAYEELGTKEEVANAQATVVYWMGVLGHYVGDCAQPLHTTNHYNGWVGENPNGYTTSNRFHTWVDSGFLNKAGITSGRKVPAVSPAAPISLTSPAEGRDPVFVAALEFIRRQHRWVEPLYQMEKAGKLGLEQQPVTDEARVFFERRLQEGSEMLGALWLTAWRAAPREAFLRGVLLKRNATTAGGTTIP